MLQVSILHIQEALRFEICNRLNALGFYSSYKEALRFEISNRLNALGFYSPYKRSIEI